MKMSKSVKAKLSLLLALVMLSVPVFRLYAANDNDKDDTSDDPFGSSETTAADAFSDFENKDVSMLFGNDNIDTKSTKIEAASNPKKDSINGSDTVAKLQNKSTSAANKAGNNGVILLSTNFMPKKSLYTVNAKMYITCDSSNDNYRYPTFVYDYVDENNWRGIAIKSVKGELTAVSVGMPTSQWGWTRPNDGYGYSQNAFKAVNAEKTEKLPYNTWVNVQAKYSKGTVEITLVSEDGYMQPFNRSANLIDGALTRIGFTTQNNEVYVDDLRISFTGNEASSDADIFLKKHAGIFNLRASTLSNDDAQALNSALSDFNALSEDAKKTIPNKKAYLDELKAQLDKISGNEKYTHKSEMPAADYWDKNKTFVYEDSFDDESALSRYIDVRDVGTWLGDKGTVTSDNAFKSSAISLKEQALRIKDELLPEKAKMQIVDFDFYVEADTPIPFYANAPIGYAYYFDKENYLYSYLANFPEDAGANEFRRYRSTYSNGGSVVPYGPQNSLKEVINPSEPVHVNYVYNDKSVSMTVTQGETTIIETEFGVCDIRGQFVLAGCDSRFNCWYDNLKITYVKGDWDIDETSDDINIYFSGSTYQDAGDAVLINGENLGNIVTDVEIEPYSVSSADKKYFDYQAFNESGVVKGTYSADPSNIVFDDSKAIAVDIIQRTEDSVKFVIPKKDKDNNDMPKGLYAVRLKGMDENTNPVEKTLILNAPHIDYTVGDDGKRISQGGYIEVVGKTLAFPISNEENNKDYSNLKALLVNKSGSVVKELPVETVYSNYNVRLSVPDDTPKGDYELWFYSGFGWSVPYNVTVDESVYNKLLSMKTVNVTDNVYTGHNVKSGQDQNATPYVQSLLDILGGQGGGVLYFPKGIYRFTQPLIIPENVSVVGENMNDTVFLWTSFNWTFGKLPKYLLGMESNSVVKNIDIYAHRTGGIISYFGNDIENVYIENVRTYSQRLSGSTTSGGHSGSYYNLSELLVLNAVEGRGWTVWTDDSAKLTNFQMKNCEFKDYANSGASAQGIRLTYGSDKSSYYQIYDSKFDSGWSPGQGNNVIVRNFDFGGACFAITGKGVLYDSNYVHDNTTNNRELFVADLSPSVSNFSGMYKDTSDTSGKTWLMPLGNRTAANLIGLQLYVVNGQGNGQTRIVTNAENTTVQGVYKITFDNAFQVEPNRNSKAIMRHARENMYFTGNTYYNGSTVGYYGGVAGVVFDSNSYQRVNNQYLWACWGDVDWYASYNNEKTVYDPFGIVSDGTEGESGYTKFKVIAGQLKYVRAIVFRNCDFNGRYLSLENTAQSAISDVVVDGCSFTKSEYGIYNDTTVYQGAGLDGALFRNNTFNEVDNPYYRLDDTLKCKNSVFTMRALIVDDRADEFVLGDVDLDGKVTLKDCTLLRLYLAEITGLSDEQLKRADMNQDNVVDLKDCGAIRAKVALLGTSGNSSNEAGNKADPVTPEAENNNAENEAKAQAEAKAKAQQAFESAIDEAVSKGLTKDELMKILEDKLK